MISRRYTPASASNSIPLGRDDSSSSSEDDDEEERILRDEPQTKPNNSSHKKRQTDADIANDLNNATVQKKKPRMVLTSDKLTGPDGFLKIRYNFPSMVKYRPPITKSNNKKKQFERDIHASAVYIGKLMQAYQQFAIDIAPNMHYNDALIKIRDLGSKKDVKDHVNMMRQEVCKAHLEKVYGREKAEKFMDELEHGFKTGEAKESVDEFELMERETGRGVAQRLANLVGDNDDNEATQKEAEKQATTASPTENGNEKVQENSIMQGSDDEEEMEANFDDVSPTPANDASDNHAATRNGNVSNEEQNSNVPNDSDDEDEEELTFDDLVMPSAKPVQPEQENTHVAEENDSNTAEEAVSEMEEKEEEANEAPTNNELEQSQESISMTQESMVFDATQDTMIMDSTKTDLTTTQEIATQDTLVEDISQTQPTQLLEELGNSQDY